MENGIPLIKKFRTEKNYYIYDTWTNEILNVHKDFWDYLPDADNPRVDEKAVGQIANLAEVQREVEKAQKLGYLSTARPEVATYYGWPNWKEEMANEINHNLQQLVLNVTEICNFRCTYCAYSGCYVGNRIHSSKQMPWEIARKSIEYAIEHSDYGANNNRPLGISFYGGEPLCNFEIIKKSVLFCKEKFPKRDVRFFMTTNGSLMNEEIADFLIEHDFSLVVSIDGPDYVHDRYRRTVNGRPTHAMTMKGYQLIKELAMAKHKQISMSMMCVTPPPFDLLAIEDFFNNIAPGKIRIAFPSLFDTTFYDQFNMKDEMKVYRLQSDRLFEKYSNDLVIGKIENRNLIGRAIFEEGLVFLKKRSMEKMGYKVSSQGQCVPGSRKLFVSSDGYFYPCEKAMEKYRIGHVDTGIDFEAIYQLMESYSKFLSPACENCWAVRICRKCFAHFDPSNAFKDNVLDNICHQAKKVVESNLINYCSILELKPSGLDFFKDILLS